MPRPERRDRAAAAPCCSRGHRRSPRCGHRDASAFKTPASRSKLFKSFVTENRPQHEIEMVASSEHWYGTRALERKLIDIIQTSDDYLLAAARTATSSRCGWHPAFAP
jgi:hypothetical protein